MCFLCAVKGLSVAAASGELKTRAVRFLDKRTRRALCLSHLRGQLCELPGTREQGFLSRGAWGRVGWSS